MIHTQTRGVAAEVGVTLLDSSNNGVNSVPVGSITVQYRKQGGSLSPKTVLAGEWNEVGDGLYKLTFTASELNTSGFFRYVVSGGSFETFRGDLQIVDDYQTVAQQVISIKEALALKTNINDADTLFEQLETRMRLAEDEIEDLENRLNDAIAALNASKN